VYRRPPIAGLTVASPSDYPRLAHPTLVFEPGSPHS